MRLHISHGADRAPDPVTWFVVEPAEGATRQSAAGTPITHDMAVLSLLGAGRAVYEADLSAGTVIRLTARPQTREAGKK